jgi:hypothetical protein
LQAGEQEHQEQLARLSTLRASFLDWDSDLVLKAGVHLDREAKLSPGIYNNFRMWPG